MGKVQKKQNTNAVEYDIHHIKVLDGVRAIAILFVVWFHLWQQSWVPLQVGSYSMDWISRTGYLMVDMMILLSGFCLFLPHAREVFLGEKADSIKTFYVKRLARIAPSYYLAIGIIFFAFAMHEYGDKTAMWKDLIPHLTFTQNLFEGAVSGTHLNGVLWTVGVEMQLYLIFPLLAFCFKKKPIVTYCAMVLVGIISGMYISDRYDSLIQVLVTNHVLTFFSVYANGMLGAYAYVAMTQNRKRNQGEAIMGTVVTIMCFYAYKLLCEHLMGYQFGSRWQVDYRFLLSLVFVVMLWGVMLSAPLFQRLFDNVVMKYIALISYNLYIWHQYIAVKLKELRIPYWEGETPPNELGDTTWMHKYLALCIVLSIVAAVATTFLVERPAAKLIMKLYNKKKGKK